jgi:hypothetical protein
MPRAAGWRKKLDDPVQAMNEKLLADRVERIEKARPVGVDLDLGLKPKPAENAVEFLADEFDRRAFGDQVATIKRIIWGPDPLVDQCPELRAALDEHGLEDYAAAAAEAIRRLGSKAVPNPLMQRSLAGAITRFGKEAVADAFAARILRIPFREVEIDASDTLDMDVMGSSVLTECIQQNERPGMAYRFFSQGCLDRYGWRGYTPVKLGNGDIVHAGTLLLGEITLARLDAKRERLARAADEALDGIADAQQAGQEQELRSLRNDGYRVDGIAPLQVGERTAYPGVENSGYDGHAGVQLSQENVGGING